MPRWSNKEAECIATVRSLCAAKLSSSAPFPEVVGDRKIVRFLRGHDYNIDKVVEMMNKFLDWRRDNSVDDIRRNIVEHGMDHPLRFPKGELIMQLIPQLVLAPDAQCKQGCPICVEQYNFVPSQVLKSISIEDYVLFVIYSLEYKSIIIEQMSEEREQQHLGLLSAEERARADDPADESEPYGVILNTVVIRDLKGVGFAHLGGQGQEIIKSVVAVASDNYPELMRKCFMINTPTVFNTVWWVIKGLLAARTVAKVSVRGSNYKNELLQEIDADSLPAMVGGTYKGYQEYKPFPFNREFLCPYLPEERSHPNISAPIISATDCCGESAEERKLSTGVAALAIASPATSAHTGDAAPSTATAAGVDDDTAAAITVAPPSSAPTVDGTDEGDSSPEHIPHIALRTSGY